MLPITAGLTPPPAPNWSQADLTQSRKELALSGSTLAVQVKTSAGPGGQAVWMRTPQSETSDARDFSAHGYPALRLAPTLFANSYRGSMLPSDLHLLRVDFHA